VRGLPHRVLKSSKPHRLVGVACLVYALFRKAAGRGRRKRLEFNLPRTWTEANDLWYTLPMAASQDRFRTGRTQQSGWLVVFILFVNACLGACSPAGAYPQEMVAGPVTPLPSVLPTGSPAIEPSPLTPGATVLLTPSATSQEVVTPSTVIVATATSTLRPTVTPLPCWSQGGRVEKEQLHSDLLPLPLEFKLYLPPCYDQLPAHRYPVLYLIHGQSNSDEQWDQLGADESADALIAAGQVAPFLIVMPRDRVWTQPTQDNFGEALIQDLLPWIDDHYRTLPDRAHRAIGGLSRGAGWSIHLGLQQWKYFGAIGAHSPAIFNSDAPGRIVNWLDAIPADSMPRIYIDLGDHDRQEIKKATAWFEDQLTRRDIPHEWHLYIGYHEDAYWSAHVTEYLRWYARDW
jgi:enterochelin esterase-like enzyme